jgi:antitoxin component YwqK of YwqJK toxin-antitoxin module
MYDKQRRFQNHKGLKLISIGLSEIGNYFYYKQPLITVWYDCMGSVGKLLSVLPYSAEYRNEVRDRLIGNLNEDYTNRHTELKEIIDPLLQAFPAGEYSINFLSGNMEQYRGDSLLGGNHRLFWGIVFGAAIDLQGQKLKLKEYQVYLNEHKQSLGYAPGSLTNFTTNGFYDGQNLSFVATQPASQINEERVKYFEEQIGKGERPFAIIFNCIFEQPVRGEDGYISDYSLNSDNYVIDGHHKLKAYHSLQLIPPVVEITWHPKTRDEITFNVEELIEVLYPWDIEHMLKNWDNKEEYIIPYLEKKDSKIHSFIKNGFIQTFHENGQIKHEAFYINDRIDGDGKWWHDNGQMEKIQFYKNRIPQGTWQMWYNSGNLANTHSYNSNGRLHGPHIWYYENGRKKREHHYNNGRDADGYSTVWYEDGTIQSEVKYEQTILTVRKNYDHNGKLLNHEEWDATERKLIKKT